SRRDADALHQLREKIDEHRAELLPLNFNSVEQLLRRAQMEQQAMLAANSEDTFREHKSRFEELSPFLERVLDIASYLRLYQNLMRDLPPLFALATGAMACLLFFAWATHPEKKTGDTKPTYIVIQNTPQAADCGNTVALPRLDPVLFATGL